MSEQLYICPKRNECGCTVEIGTCFHQNPHEHCFSTCDGVVCTLLKEEVSCIYYKVEIVIPNFKRIVRKLSI